MKISSKITKRQYTSFNKKNDKMLAEEIDCALQDYKAIAFNLALNENCIEGLDDKLTDGGYRDSTKHYMKELNSAYRLFITQRNKIYKAYLKGIK